MSVIQKIIISAASIIVLAAAGYFLKNGSNDSTPKQIDGPEKIVADYKDLLTEAEKLQQSVGANCDNKKEVNKKIAEMEKKLVDLSNRKNQWLENVPKLPDVEPELVPEEPLGRPGSEVPELSSSVPPLPDIYPEDIEVLGSQVPELSSNVPPLPDISDEYIPEMPELNPGRPGSEVPELSSDVPELPDIYPEDIEVPGSQVPELSSDVPELPEISEMNIFDPDEHIFQIDESERKIKNILQALKDLCQEEEPAPKVISDKCSDACQRHKDCAAYTEDVTAADLDDAYNTCMEECITWPQEVIKCINAIDIKNPNDCVSFMQCQLPQLYEERYLR
ncbi:MAG: hypothetical protein WCW61_03360 [Patescibacteria group bacterium]